MFFYFCPTAYSVVTDTSIAWPVKLGLFPLSPRVIRYIILLNIQRGKGGREAASRFSTRFKEAVPLFLSSASPSHSSSFHHHKIPSSRYLALPPPIGLEAVDSLFQKATIPREYDACIIRLSFRLKFSCGPLLIPCF